VTPTLASVRIDLHTHSTASDGTDSPAELIAAAAAAGLDVVALTDHDTFSGLAEAASAAERTGVRLVPGVEVSCVAGDVPFHLLAYWCDPTSAPLVAELELNRDDRIPRAMEITRRLAEAGFPLTWDDVMAQVPTGATVGRPHLADALVAAGVVADRDEAFVTLLHDGSPYVVGHHYVDHRAVIDLVRGAGGVAVVAHIGAAKRGRLLSVESLEEMVADGLVGLEVDHPDHDAATRERLCLLAHRLGLLPTGSSDYHGTGKRQGLGADTTDPAVFEALEVLARAAREATV
jgi:3',5'-nucleoside bisphosphate phosphatase